MAAASLGYWVFKYCMQFVFEPQRMVYDEWNGYHWVDWDHDEEAYARAMTGSAKQREDHAKVCYICGDFALGNAALGNGADMKAPDI